MSKPASQSLSRPVTSPFLTNAWRENWWSVWGSDIEGHRIMGEPPCGDAFYVHRYLWRYLPVRSLQFVGTGDRRLSTPRAEYLALPASYEGTSLDCLLKDVWTEAVFRDLVAGSESHERLKEWARSRNFYTRTVLMDRAYQVNVTGDLSNYLQSLGPNTRLKLYNRRKRLSSLGAIGEESWPPDRFLSLLNQFHVKRWGVPCFNAQSQRFHRGFLRDIVEEGGIPDLRVLTLDGKPVSVLYNLIWGDRVYNIQSGFQEGVGKDLAVGTLHLGYALEDAFASGNLAWFDLLAGQGKNTDYKRHLATHELPLVSLMVVRHPFYRLLYRVLDSVKYYRP